MSYNKQSKFVIKTKKIKPARTLRKFPNIANNDKLENLHSEFSFRHNHAY